MINTAKAADQGCGKDEAADFEAMAECHGNLQQGRLASHCFNLGDGIEAVKGKVRIGSPFRISGFEKTLAVITRDIDPPKEYHHDPYSWTIAPSDNAVSRITG